jgi:hypothetical protein
MDYFFKAAILPWLLQTCDIQPLYDLGIQIDRH